MKLNKGQITILVDKEGVTIELMDGDSRIDFAKVKLTPEQFTTALSRLMNTDCTIECFRLDLVGKKMIHKEFVFEMPVSRWDKDVEAIAVERGKKLCPEGWEPDLYFRSQDSFFEKDGKCYARTTIRKWE